MAEEFQTGICGGAWWINPTRSSSLSPCSAAGIGLSDHMGSFLWPSNDHFHMVDTKTTTLTPAGTATTEFCEESANNNNNNNSVSADTSSMAFTQNHQQTDSDSGGSSSILMDSTLQMMSLVPSSSSSSTDCFQVLLRGNGRAENNYRSMRLEDLNSQIQKEWSPSKGYASSAGAGDHHQECFSLDQSHPVIKSATASFSDNCTVSESNCQGLSPGFPVDSASYGYTSALLQSYFEPQPQPVQQQSLYSSNNTRSMGNYMSTANYGNNYNEVSPPWPKFAAASFVKPSLPKQQQPSGGLLFSNNTPFWNATALNDISRPGGLLAAALGEKRTCPTFTARYNNNEEVRDSGSAAKKGSSEPAFKRPRIETPSPLPTFKVRKEKLGDRITALQQLVSPFGKTDTASVLHEAIDYIKFLHDQVNVLTTPYMKQGTQIPQQQSCDHKLKDPEAPKQDLNSRGLCLVPISSTFPVANETTADFWTPTFGGTYR
ncbi:hypothetical protein AB3S75_008455 [Citrus x aurantiifolia]